jgi:hypothetical protein
MAGEAVDRTLWNEIAEYAARWFPSSGILFADVHAALAFAMAGNRVALHRIIENRQAPAADILLPIARGFDAFARGKWAKVVEEIGPVLETHERVGGSRAQRDLLEYTVTCALSCAKSGSRDPPGARISACSPMASPPKKRAVHRLGRKLPGRVDSGHSCNHHRTKSFEPLRAYRGDIAKFARFSRISDCRAMP